MGVKFAVLALAVHLPLLCAAQTSEWTLVRSAHFEVYSHVGERDARAALLWFEGLRQFFVNSGLASAGALDANDPVRVVRFRSREEYAAFRLRPGADAYFLATEGAEYVVMPVLGTAAGAGIAAHEYAHLVLHSLGLKLPPWLSEGIAEFYSSVRIAYEHCLIGGDLPARTAALRHRPWIPLPELIALAAVPSDRRKADVFYAESWALASMLVESPEYAPRFAELLKPHAATVTGVYGEPLSVITSDLRAWVQRPRSATSLPGVAGVNERVEVSTLPSFDSHLILADLLLACGDLVRAEAAYQALADERPGNATVAAALGSIAVRKGDPAAARIQFKLAMQLGTRDARLCYRYATLAEDAGLPADEIADALRRAIELKPNFDDARYRLGVLENNRGQYDAAIAQFRAMRNIPGERAYGYWTAMATALTETDDREEAKKAAAKAMLAAANAEQRTFASQLAYAAGTDLTVQFSRDANGNLQLVTARKPHGNDDWNPFVEAGDHLVSFEGQLRRVECSAGRVTGFRIENASAAVEVALPDPSHVLIRGGTPEFVCGAEDGREVEIQYAAAEKRAGADGVLRGMEFR